MSATCLEYLLVGLVVLACVLPLVGVVCWVYDVPGKLAARREARRAWERWRAEINKQRLGLTPHNEIPAAWLRRRR